jgi:hypothetical protein
MIIKLEFNLDYIKLNTLHIICYLLEMSTASSFFKLNPLNRRSYKELAEEESLLLSKQAYRNFVNSINSQATKRTYVFALQKFMQFLNLKDIEQ